MIRFALCLAASLVMVSSASAQVPGAAAKRAARSAVKATNAHTTAEETGADQPVARQSGASRTVQQGAANKAASKPGPAKKGRAGGTGLAVGTRSDTAANVPPAILREVFVYDAAGRRDPFVSLLTTSELRPALSDLKLTGILYDMSGRRPVATLRDRTDNTQYTVTLGTALGRMRVAAIRPKVVVFSIDEFGQNRLDSLVLGDSTKVRAK